MQSLKPLTSSYIQDIVIKFSWSFGSYLPNSRRITHHRKSLEMDANEKVRLLFAYTLLNTTLTFSQSKGWVLRIQVKSYLLPSHSRPSFRKPDTDPQPNPIAHHIRLKMWSTYGSRCTVSFPVTLFFFKKTRPANRFTKQIIFRLWTLWLLHWQTLTMSVKRSKISIWTVS